MQNQLNQLKTHLLEINDLESACNLLHWDQATYMPSGGATARGRQMATLRKIAHDKFTSPIIGELLASLQNYAQNLPDNSDDVCLIRITQRHYNKAIQVPAEFMAKLAIHQAECYKMWSKYRSENNFKAVLPDLEKTLELSREYANFFKYEQIADPLIEDADYGMKTETVRSLFTELRKKLVPIVEEITAKSEIDNSFLNQYFPEDKQLEFSRKVLDKMGYDWSRGRQDKTLHPFMTKFSLGDVRITTRVYENNLEQCLFCSMHEMGHAFYEMGINPNYEGTPLAHGTSSGVHESQSRLWENLVGRSREFWHYFYPQLQIFFPEQLNNIDEETFYQGINKVKRSLIRTDADEVTYNLHIMIRFELELALLEGQLAVQDLPDAWNELYESYLGIKPDNDSIGVMQDVHWYGGMIGGAFQGYTLGNLIAAQFYQTALKHHPEIPEEIAQGNFNILHDWLKENIYQHGQKYTTSELIEKVTGQILSIDPLINYIQKKYE